MTNTIHVVNGDSTAKILTKSTVKGDVVVWREMLCEGPLQKEVGSDAFWKERYTFFENEFGVTKLEYYDKTIKEVLKLEDLKNYKNVVLWFEFDLFCQVNLLALCTYLLAHYVKKANYYLICTGVVNHKKALQSLADFSPSEFKILYENKQTLSKTSLMFAQESWNLFVENNFEKLQQFNFNKNNKFQYLQSAINQHLKRFPNKNGLNQIDAKILEIIHNNSFSEKEIIKNLLIWQRVKTVYGFGNLQYNLYLKKLKNYYKIIDSRFYLTNEGIAKIV
jgi:hypothetical protein